MSVADTVTPVKDLTEPRDYVFFVVFFCLFCLFLDECVDDVHHSSQFYIIEVCFHYMKIIGTVDMSN